MCSHLSINPVGIEIPLQTQTSLVNVCRTSVSTNWTPMYVPLVTSLFEETLYVLTYLPSARAVLGEYQLEVLTVLVRTERSEIRT